MQQRNDFRMYLDFRTSYHHERANNPEQHPLGAWGCVLPPEALRHILECNLNNSVAVLLYHDRDKCMPLGLHCCMYGAVAIHTQVAYLVCIDLVNGIHSTYRYRNYDATRHMPAKPHGSGN